jgi:hypothetical protein
MSTKWSTVIVAGLFMMGLAETATALEPTRGEVLSFHSEGSGECPNLDWYLVVGANKQLTGLIAWDDMKTWLGYLDRSLRTGNSTWPYSRWMGPPVKAASTGSFRSILDGSPPV